MDFTAKNIKNFGHILFSRNLHNGARKFLLLVPLAALMFLLLSFTIILHETDKIVSPKGLYFCAQGFFVKNLTFLSE